MAITMCKKKQKLIYLLVMATTEEAVILNSILEPSKLKDTARMTLVTEFITTFP